jgi:hypothetical protein
MRSLGLWLRWCPILGFSCWMHWRAAVEVGLWWMLAALAIFGVTGLVFAALLTRGRPMRLPASLVGTPSTATSSSPVS